MNCGAALPPQGFAPPSVPPQAPAAPPPSAPGYPPGYAPPYAPPTYPPYATYAPPNQVNFSNLFTGMFRVWSENFVPLFLVYLVLTLITGTIGIVGGILLFGVPYLASGLAGVSLTTPSNADLWLFVGWTLVATVLGWIITSTVIGGVTDFSVRRHRGERVRIEDSLRRGFQRFLSILGANLLVGLIVIGLVLLPLTLIVAGAIVAIGSPTAGVLLICGSLILWPFLGVLALYIVLALSLFAPVIMMENAHAMDSLNRSWTLTKGHKWSLLGAGIVIGIIGAIIQGVIVFGAYLSANPVLEVIASALAAGVTAAWFTILTSVAYDLIVRQPQPTTWPPTMTPTPPPVYPPR